MLHVKVTILSLFTALGLMMFSAGGVAAGEKRGDFKLRNGAGTIELLKQIETFGGDFEDASLSSLLVPNLNFAIRCHTLDITNGTFLPLNASSESIGHANLTFLGCLAFTHKTLEALVKCTVGNGTIQANVLLRVVRTGPNSKAYLLTQPSSGSVFTKIEFGPLCGALAEEEIEIAGTLLSELTSLEAVKQTLQEAPAEMRSLFGDSLKFGTNQAFTDGSILLFLTGAHIGRMWGIEAGS